MKIANLNIYYNEIFKVVLFGFLSIFLSKIQLTVPGAQSGLSDMREIALLVAVFYFRHWYSVILIAIITSFSIPPQGSFMVNVIIHAISLSAVYYLYQFLSKNNISQFNWAIIWIVIVSIYFYLLIVPLLSLFFVIFGFIELSHFSLKYITSAQNIWFEVLITTVVTLLYLMYLKAKELLEVRKYELEKALSKAKESEELKSAFLYNLSKIISSPLKILLNNSEQLEKEKSNENVNNKYVDLISNSSEQLRGIIKDVVDASYIEIGQLKLDLKETTSKEIFTGVDNLLKCKWANDGSRVKLQFITSNKLLFITDAAKLIRINYHLIDNALKFSKDDVIVTSEVQDSILKIKIIDKGIGISDRDKSEVFLKFRQLDRDIKRNYGGNGIGLTIVKGFVEKMNGKIWFDSEPNEGTTFNVEIPVK